MLCVAVKQTTFVLARLSHHEKERKRERDKIVVLCRLSSHIFQLAENKSASFYYHSQICVCHCIIKVEGITIINIFFVEFYRFHLESLKQGVISDSK